jgi:site-specific DNA recombinase
MSSLQAAGLLAWAESTGRGNIVAEFFDIGQSRVLAWALRPQAAALAAALADPGRGWEAIVIGECERAFYGAQYASMAPLVEHYRVQLWPPEAGGRAGSSPPGQPTRLWSARPTSSPPRTSMPPAALLPAPI